MVRTWITALLSLANLTLFAQGPSVIATYPAPNAHGIAGDTVISIVFDQAINPATIYHNTIVVQSSFDGALSGEYSYDPGTFTVTFSPSESFRVADHVYATVNSGVLGVGENSAATGFAWEFTIGSSDRGGKEFEWSAVFENLKWNIEGILTADFNNDQISDIVFATRRTIQIWTGGLEGYFKPLAQYSGNFTGLIRTNDLDHDGNVDLIATNPWGDSIYVFLGSAEGYPVLSSKLKIGSGIRLASNHDIETADLNTDGNLDIIMTGLFDGFAILSGNGDGSFQQPIIRGGGHFQKVSANDLNLDGKIDLILANAYSGLLEIYLNDGDWSFSHTSTIPFEFPVASFAAGDINNDGMVDLVVCEPYTSIPTVWNFRIVTLEGNGEGFFGSPISLFDRLLFTDRPINPVQIELGEFSGDNALDLIFNLPVWSQGNVLAKGDGDGSFSDYLRINQGAISNSTVRGTKFAYSDFNGDGLSDVAMIHLTGGSYENNSEIHVYLNRSDAPDIAISASEIRLSTAQANVGTYRNFTVYNRGVDSILTVDAFTPEQSVFAASPESLSVLPGDSATLAVFYLPTDQLPQEEVLTLQTNDPMTPEVHITLKGSVFTVNPLPNALNVSPQAPITVTFPKDIQPGSIHAGTFVVRSDQTGRIGGTYNYNPSSRVATFKPASPYKPGEMFFVSLTAGIIDVEGHPAINPYTWSFKTGSSHGSRAFSNYMAHPLDETPYSLVAADLDGDDDIDLASANGGQDALTYMIYKGEGKYDRVVAYSSKNESVKRSIHAADILGGNRIDIVLGDLTQRMFYMFEAIGTYRSYPMGAGPSSFASADWDSDGDFDLIVNGEHNVILVMENTGEPPTFGGWLRLADTASSIAVVDMNRDGHPDIVATIPDSNCVVLFRGNGNGTFALPQHFPAGTDPQALVTVDLDRDGIPDLATVNQSAGEVAILFGDEDGNLALPVHYEVGEAPTAILADDLDQDGNQDIVIADSINDEISILFGNGNGTFAAPVSYSVGAEPVSIVSADLDGDGDLDLATANTASGDISILYNDDLFLVNSHFESREVYADTILIPFAIYNPARNATGLLCEYLSLDGSTWMPATIVGDTSGLTPANYEGILQWASGTDLPTQDIDSARIRITPYDQTSPGRSFITASFPLNNNKEPVATITPIYIEQSGDVTIQYTLSDDEGDTLAFDAKYSSDRGKNWQVASITGADTNLSSVAYVGSLVWHSLTDLPGCEDSLIYFQIIPRDNETGTQAIVVIYLDNNEPPALAMGSTIIDTVISQALIPYIITDLENDTISIVAFYSLDQGQTWQQSVVEGAGQAVAPADYIGQVVWLAFADLYGKHEGVQLQLVPYDYDPGIGDTLTGLTVINYPGDYTGDLAINANDLVLFAAAWNAEPQGLAYEIGPASGSIPDLLPQPDGVLDFQDLIVFTQMWNWSFAYNGFLLRTLAKTTTGKSSLRLVQRLLEDLLSTETSDEVTVDILLENTPELMIIEGLLTLDPQRVRFVGVEDGGYLGQYYQTTPLFINVSPDSSQVLFTIVGLGSASSNTVESIPALTLTLENLSHNPETVSVDYVMRDVSGADIAYQTAAIELQPLLPSRFNLYQNFPNPFNSTTSIRFELPRPADADLVVYDILGREVTRLKQGELSAGYYQVLWDGRDQAGRNLASGIYIARLVTLEYNKSIKMVLLK